MGYRSTKVYGHELGLSACFRQPRAVHSHCSLLHGYALSFKFVFEADALDKNGWVMDFGGLKGLKKMLQDNFDHKVLVAGDDPYLGRLVELEALGIASVNIMPNGVGCENFARYAWSLANAVLIDQYCGDIEVRGLRVISCECAEHGANSAIYSIE